MLGSEPDFKMDVQNFGGFLSLKRKRKKTAYVQVVLRQHYNLSRNISGTQHIIAGTCLGLERLGLETFLERLGLEG